MHRKIRKHESICKRRKKLVIKKSRFTVLAKKKEKHWGKNRENVVQNKEFCRQ